MNLEVKPTKERGIRTGIAILVVGILAGIFLKDIVLSGIFGAEEYVRPLTAPLELKSYLRSASSEDKQRVISEQNNGLETLVIDFEVSEAVKLQKVREESMNRGVIIQTEEDMIRGKVALGDAVAKADLRIKGDWTDHIDSDKWSLRIKLKDTKLNGMAVFSIQHPKTRGMLWEWFALKTARHEGLLAPRSTFVNVVLNGNAMGIYYLEEHFSKELLESQGRREGPVVLWDESTRWSSLLQAHSIPSKGVNLPVPKSAARIWGPKSAPIRAYGEKRLTSVESLSRSLYSGVEQMARLKDLITADSTMEDRLARMEAIARIEGETVENLIDTKKLSRMHALASLFQIKHAIIWHNLRFYHDPVLDRLEPILFDCNAHQPSSRDVVMFRQTDVTSQFNKSNAYYNGVFNALGEFCEHDYLDSLMEEFGEELLVYEAALHDEFELTGLQTVPGMLQRLRTEQTFLQGVIEPVDPVNFRAAYEVIEDPDSNAVSSNLIVDAWTTTRTPVVIEGFKYSNGVTTAARGIVAEGESGYSETPDGFVVLPNDGRVLRFSFPMNNRIINLENVKQVLETMRNESEASSLDLEISAVFRPIAAKIPSEELLNFRPEDPSWISESGRPNPPSLNEALKLHPCLEYRSEVDELWVKPGLWKIAGDLVIPSGFALHARKSRLAFEEDAVLLTDAPLIFTDTTLHPMAKYDRWRGVIVLQAKGRSIWNNVTVRATDSVSRAGWAVTGGITFYRSPVTMTDCHIEGTWAEDGTNVFGADCVLERTRFTACVSDSFDGDFVTGRFIDCVFQDGLADGVDVSGSDVSVENCQFLNMGDKGISAGENSIVRVSGGLCDGVALGIAAKDRSQVTVNGMTIRNARNYALTAFVKKPEYGAAQLTATNLTIEGSGLGEFLVQTGCSLSVDGESIPSQDLDVKQLYKDKVLGQ